MLQLLDKPQNRIQPKLIIGEPNDKYEQEADAVAERVVQGATPGLQMMCAECAKEEEEKLQMQPTDEEEEVQLKPEAPQILSMRSGEFVQRNAIIDWIKRWIANGRVINNSSRRVRVWSSDKMQERGSERIEDGLYWIRGNDSSASVGEDVDHVRDIHGNWFKIGFGTAYVRESGEVIGATCQVSGPGEDCSDDTERTTSSPSEQPAPTDAGMPLPGGMGSLNAGVLPKMQKTQFASGHKKSDSSEQLEFQLSCEKGKGESIPKQVNTELSHKIGADFSDVKIHTDQKSAEMNQQLGAQAFTHGRDIYFNKGKYNPSSFTGKHLLAHELAHVVQQNGQDRNEVQRLTCRVPVSTSPPARAAQGQANPLNATATSIIGIASNRSLNNTQKAQRLITAIVCNYYPQHQSLVRNVLYVSNTAGLITTRIGRGSSARGDITVGDYFIQHATRRGISRRILQVGHELRHILQYRRGLIGRRNKDEREFLAFHENALADEFVGTGRMSNGTRRRLIDASLGYYYCLSSPKQRQYVTQKNALLVRRGQISSSRSGSAPTSCTRP